jgi:ABC-2 type transport system permease protein
MKHYLTLLKREYWEHRGGFLWAPIWVASSFVVLIILALVTALWHTSGKFNGQIFIGVPLKKLIEGVAEAELPKFGLALDLSLIGFWIILQFALFFVVFFYLLGALYDDRKDRSILFWKSLPVSDIETVLAKVIAAAWLAPLISFAITVLLGLGFLSLLSVFVLAHGGNPITLIWGPAEPAALYCKLLMTIPVNFIWSLPAVGWLLLASSFARSKPFLWAVALPAIIGGVLAWFQVMSALQLPDSWYWKHVFVRFVAGLTPGTWPWNLNPGQNFNIRNLGEETMNLASLEHIGNILSSQNTWAAVPFGAALIIAAIYFRRKRELAD